jgi:hypothetical protein
MEKIIIELLLYDVIFGKNVYALFDLWIMLIPYKKKRKVFTIVKIVVLMKTFPYM